MRGVRARGLQRAEQVIELVDGGFLQAWNDVRVYTQRHLDAGISQSLGDDLRVHARDEKQGCLAVAQRIKRDLRVERRLRQERPEITVQQVARAQRLAVGPAKTRS